MPTERVLLFCIVLGIAQSARCDANAQSYPVRPIRMIVPSSPGGTSDIFGRLLAQKLSENLAQQVVIENRPGASAVVGTDFVARSAPDGYTVLITPAALAINPFMYAKLPFDTQRDLAPITLLAETPNVLIVHPSVPVRDLNGLIALAKKQPGRLVSASPGIGGSPHMSVELLKIMAGIDLLIVPYKGGGPSIIALISGEVSLMFTNPPTVRANMASGRVRPLAVSTRTRNPALPEIPTIDEAGVPGYDASQWFGLLAPAGTPRPIIERLHQETLRIIKSAEMKERFMIEGLRLVGNTPDEFARYIGAELEKWEKVIRTSGIKPLGARQ